MLASIMVNQYIVHFGRHFDRLSRLVFRGASTIWQSHNDLNFTGHYYQYRCQLSY